jgi:protease-4
MVYNILEKVGDLMFKKIFLSVVIICAMVAILLSFKSMNNKNEESEFLSNSPVIAVVNIFGTVMGGEGTENPFSQTNAALSGTVMKEIRKASNDPNVKALIIRLNTPGGSVTAAEEISREINRFKEKTHKPVIAAMGDTAASAGYWLAAHADKIYANNTTLTGSIGVYMPYMNFNGIYDKIGLKTKKIKSGKFKDIMSPDRPMTKEEEQLLQNMVDEMYEQFVDVIVEGRHMPREKVLELADGRVYTGRQAKKLGLVDDIGNYYDVLDATAKMVGIEGEPKVKTYTGTTWKSLFSVQGISNVIVGEITKAVGEVLTTKGSELQTRSAQS